MRSIISVLALSLLLSFTASSRADGPSRVGPYFGWELTGWFPRDTLSARLGHADNGAQFALVLGMRIHHVAFEVWHSPPMNSGVDVRGLDAKFLVPLGRYFSAYGRLRVAKMKIEVDDYPSAPDPSVAKLSGLGTGGAVGIQANFAGGPFGLIVPAYYWLFGPKGTGGIFVEFGHETYALCAPDEPPRPPERFWRFAYGLTWGGAF